MRNCLDILEDFGHSHFLGPHEGLSKFTLRTVFCIITSHGKKLCFLHLHLLVILIIGFAFSSFLNQNSLSGLFILS